MLPSESIFKRVSTLKLFSMAVFYKSCQYESLVSGVSKVFLSNSPLKPLLKPFVRHTSFKLFCGGESLDDCRQVSNNLLTSCNIRTIIDHSTEEKLSENSWELNMNQKQHLIREASKTLGRAVSHIPIKCTAVLCPAMLERLCVSGIDPLSNAIEKMSSSDRGLFDSGINRLRVLCQTALNYNIPLLLDAEQSTRQPAIELIARMLSKEFNLKGRAPVIFNTYQMYLKRTTTALQNDIQTAQNEDYVFAAKIVRGAYVHSERQVARATGCEDPTLPTKEDTDRAYDNTVEMLLHHISDASSAAMMYIVIATHNNRSIESAVAAMLRLNIERNDPRVHFAQILGMADNCTNKLGLGQYNVSKLIPFGPFDELLPWLLRRLDENKDMLGAMQLEKHVYFAELIKRVRFWQ